MIETKGESVKVRHILADGTMLDSIEGHVVPATGETEITYKFLAEYFMKYYQNEGINHAEK